MFHIQLDSLSQYKAFLTFQNIPVTIGSKTTGISITEYLKISVVLNGQFYSGRLISLPFHPSYVLASFSVVMFFVIL